MDVLIWSAIVLLALGPGAQGAAEAEEALCFPKGFLFGVATAAYQVEGAWNVSDKGESIWDRYLHAQPARSVDGSNGDVADDSYHRAAEDAQLAQRLGVHFVRFSVSWPRLLPTGLDNKVSADGVRYYSSVLAALRRAGLRPLVTMYHWDLPQSLQELGGWTNPVVADYFVDYARVLFERFGSSVQRWLTFNEPLSFCHNGYGGLDAPGRNASGREDYLCAHNVLRAHAAVYRMYERDFKPKQKGSIGITLDFDWSEPLTTSKQDQEAAERARQFMFGWFAHPIFSSTGDYPAAMRARVDAASRAQGYTRSRLPSFTAEEVVALRGAADFLGLNHYTTHMAQHRAPSVDAQPTFSNDMHVALTQRDDWPKSASSWLRVVPWGFRKALNWIRLAYSNPPVLITENGVSSGPGLRDARRVAYLRSYLRALHAAVVRDRCRVLGYTHWSLLDNLEWRRGFTERFGLHEVDFASAARTRTPRLSARYFAAVASGGCLPDDRDLYHLDTDQIIELLTRI